MPSSYINQLNRLLDEDEDAAAPPPQEPDLHQRFKAWIESLPEVSRHRAFAMVELERALNTQGKYLSPILLRLGWQRRRKWTATGHCPRYWVPPRAPPN